MAGHPPWVTVARAPSCGLPSIALDGDPPGPTYRRPSVRCGLPSTTFSSRVATPARPRLLRRLAAAAALVAVRSAATVRKTDVSVIRRVRDITEQLQPTGWVFIPASERGQNGVALQAGCYRPGDMPQTARYSRN